METDQMPGYDGKGPRGQGPMTGGGKGYCIVKIPRTPDEALTGFSGLACTPLVLLPDSSSHDIVSLRFRVLQVKLALQEIDRRISVLEALTQGTR